ncbi:MAG: sugar transferase [Acidobacteria bacterium]|nr:sugar transferase [Acidobacteriota bacterium]
MIRLFRISMPVSVVGLLVSEAVLAFCCYLAAWALVGDVDVQFYLLFESGGEKILLVVASILLGAYFNDLYSEVKVASRLRLAQQYCLVIGMAFLTQALLSYVYPDLIVGRWQMMVGSALGLVLLPGWRSLFSMLVLQVWYREKVLFVGANSLVLTLARTFHKEPQLAMTSLGYLAEEPLEGDFPGLGPWLGKPRDILEVHAQQKPDRIVVGLNERRGQMPVNELLSLRLSGRVVEFAAAMYERITWRVSVEALRPSHLIFSHELGPNPRNLALQRVYSFVVALVGVVITAPVMLGVWLAVRLTSPGAAVYSQRRVGLNGKEFNVMKFRSMYIDAEARTGAVWAQKNDPRITPVGRWLRKLRLDELPQFFNVLKGEMSIVGPRPERPEFVRVLSEQIPFYGQRHTILPGITGWAQINHKYGDTLEDTVTKLEYDLYYLKNVGPSLDLYVIFHTVKVMLLSRGSQ